MKKTTGMMVILALTASLAACGESTTAETTVAETTVEETSTAIETAEPESESEVNALEAIANLEVEKELFDVTITVPADYIGDLTPEKLEENCKEYGYKGEFNEDGSVTYTMTKSQHKAMMDEIRNNFDDGLQELVGSENYPNYVDIKSNSDFTSFSITTKSEELDISESFSILLFYMYGNTYNIFNGTTVDNIHVEFINADSGKVIYSSDSKDNKQ